MYHNKRVGVVVPAHNEEAAIGIVVSELLNLRANAAPLVDALVVCANHCSDATAAVAERAGAQVVREPRKGYGRACLFALAALPAVDYVAFVDGDGACDPEDLPALLAALHDGAELVIGSRPLGKRSPGALYLHQRLGTALASRCLSAMFGRQVTDLGPLRAIRQPALQRLDMTEPTFGWTAEMQTKALALNLRVSERPAASRRRHGRSKVSGTLRGSIGAGIGIFRAIFRYRRFRTDSLLRSVTPDEPRDAAMPAHAELSHVTGATAPALIDHTIGDALVQAATEFADREALVSVHQNVRLTYAELLAQADALATGLLDLGLHPGDRVGIWAPTCAEWTLTQYATARAGLILVNINPAYRRFELEYALNKVGCAALVVAERFKTSAYFEMLNDLAPELASSTPGQLRSEKLPALRAVIGIAEQPPAGFIAFKRLLQTNDLQTTDRERLQSIGAGLSPDDAINIQFTSGTTGSPKGATLSHRNILNNGYFVGAAINLGPADRLAVPVPLYHCFGMVMGNLGCLTHGATVVYPDAAFEPGSVLQTVQNERCTALYGVPTMFVAELALENFADYDLSTLRTGIMAGSPCPVEVMKRVVSDMNMSEVTIAYGMTETSPVSFQSSVADSIDRRVSTVGRVLPHIEVKVIDEQGNTVPRGVTGELCTKGYSVMSGYWDDPERTAEALVDGWMHTGDLATIDAEGYGNIVGRVKDMVIRGGENLYPREIEEFLYTHTDITEVAVFGVPDDKYGEELCAWVQTAPGADLDEADIKAFCQGQIAHFKIPRYVRLVDEFPMTVTGKIQKFQMRDAMCAELNLAEQATA